MNDVTFSVEIVECEQHAAKTSSEQVLCKSMSLVARQEVSEAFPKRLLDNASMSSTLSLNREHIQCCPDVPKSRVCRGTCLEVLVHPKLILAALASACRLSGPHVDELCRKVSTGAVFGMHKADRLQIAREPHS